MRKLEVGEEVYILDKWYDSPKKLIKKGKVIKCFTKPTHYMIQAGIDERYYWPEDNFVFLTKEDAITYLETQLQKLIKKEQDKINIIKNIDI